MGLIQRFCNWLLYKHLGYRKEITVDHPQKYIICLAPHTSNWDFFFGQLYMRAEGMRCSYLMKKEWFFWPLGVIFRKTGGIPVYRQKHLSMTDVLSQAASDAEEFRLTITPEGTRKLNPDWKKGFYFIAHKAGIPILLYSLDYEKKLIRCTKSIVPTGDVEADMRDIKLYFKDVKGKYPEKFTIGNV